MSAVLPNFLIIGAQKSGTTSLVNYLSAHPEVFVVPNKEVHYFDLHFNNGLDWYKNQFSGVTTQRVVGEKTPNYMYLEEVPGRMAEALPGARLVAILRNPVDRAYSHYWHNRRHGRETLEFGDAIAAEPKGLASDDYERKYRHHSYLDRGRYLNQLRRVCEFYPREALHLILFDDLCRDPLGTFRSLCGFLEIDDTFVPPDLGSAFNSFGTFRSSKLRAIIRRSPFIPRGFQKMIHRANYQKTSYQPMDPLVRAELLERFQEDNAALSSWLGRDLSFWNK